MAAYEDFSLPVAQAEAVPLKYPTKSEVQQRVDTLYAPPGAGTFTPDVNALSSFKKNLLQSKSQEKSERLLNKRVGLLYEEPSLESLPDFEAKEILKKTATSIQELRNINTRLRDERVAREANAFLTDDQADTTIGSGINTFIGGVGAAADLGGALLNLPSSILNANDRLYLQDNAFDIHASITQKLASGTQFTEEEDTFFAPIYKTDKNGKRRLKSISQYEIVENIAARTQLKESINVGVASVQGWTNSRNKDLALKAFDVKIDKSLSEFDTDNIWPSVATYLGGVLDIATDSPDVAMQIIGETLPHMIALVKAPVTTVGALSGEGFDEAMVEFEAEHGREATTGEKALAGGLVTFANAIDLLASKGVLQGKGFINKIVKLSNLTGSKIPTGLLKRVQTALKGKGKSVLKSSLGFTAKTTGVVASKVLTNKVTKDFVEEGLTEGIQNFLTQLAGKQDLSKINRKEILRDAGLGSVAGAGIGGTVSTPAAIIKTVSTATKVVKKTTKKTKEKLVEHGVGKAEKIIAKAEETKDAELGLNAFNNINYGALSEEDALTKLTEYNTFLEKFKSKEYDSKNTDETARARLIKKHDEVIIRTTESLLRKREGNKNYRDAVEYIVRDRSNETSHDLEQEAKVIPLAINTVVNNINTVGDISFDDAVDVLGSEEFKAAATDEDVKVIKEYKDYLEATSKLETKYKKLGENKKAGEVHSDVIEGSPDGNFVGIAQHIKNVRKALLGAGDPVAIEGTLKKLSNFRQKQFQKLQARATPESDRGTYTAEDGEIKPHTAKFKNIVHAEIDLINRAINQINNMGKPLGITPGKIGTTKAAAQAKPVVATPTPEVVDTSPSENPGGNQSTVSETIEDTSTFEDADEDADIESFYEYANTSLAETKTENIPKPSKKTKTVLKAEDQVEDSGTALNLSTKVYKVMVQKLNETFTVERSVIYKGEEATIHIPAGDRLVTIDTAINNSLEILKRCG